MRKTLNGPGIKLVLDHDNPDTPAMVYDKKERFSATWHCATDVGELLGSRETLNLSNAQLDWLNAQEDAVEEAYNVARKDNPEYG